MPTYPEFTDGANNPTSALPAGWLSLTREVASGWTTYKLWNNRAGTPGGATMRNVTIEAFYRMTALSALTREGEPGSSQWAEGYLTGAIDDPTNGTSGALPGDYAAITTPTIGIGGMSPWVIRDAVWPDQFSRSLALRIYPRGAGEADAVNRIYLRVSTDRGVWSLPALQEAREGDGVFVFGGAAFNTVLRGRELEGWRLKVGQSDLTKILVPEMTLWLNRFEVIHCVAFESAAFDLLDGAGVALIAGEDYRILVSRDTTSSSPTSTGFAFTRGLKAATGSALLPALPANHIALGYCTRTFPLGAALFDFTTIISPEIASVRKSSGLQISVGSYIATINNGLIADGGSRPLTTDNGATRYVNYNRSNVWSIDSTAGGAGKRPVARVVAAGGTVTAVQPMVDVRAPNSSLVGRHAIVDYRDARLLDDENVLYFFGQLARGDTDNLTGATVLDVPDVGGAYVGLRINSYTAGGVATVTGTAVDGALTETGASTETLLVTQQNNPAAADYGCPWLWTRTRWWGSGANDPDVVVSADTSLQVNATAYAAHIEDNDGKPFQIRKLRVWYFAMSTLAAFRVYLYKVAREGLVTVYDSTAKSNPFGTPAPAAAFKPRWRMFEISVSGGSSTDVPWEDCPSAARVDPLNREGIYGVVDAPVDVGMMVFKLIVDDKLRG